jgi:hypothetical protein
LYYFINTKGDNMKKLKHLLMALLLGCFLAGGAYAWQSVYDMDPDADLTDEEIAKEADELWRDTLKGDIELSEKFERELLKKESLSAIMGRNHCGEVMDVIDAAYWALHEGAAYGVHAEDEL